MSYTSAWSDDFLYFPLIGPDSWVNWITCLHTVVWTSDKTTVIHIPVIFIVDFVFLSSYTGVYRPSICHMTMHMRKWM
jgi:hypothetical protein